MVFVGYPAEFICPTELGEMVKYYSIFTDLGAEVFSVCKDSAYVHKAWHDSNPYLKTILQ
ncbi:redoxin domain-containing protein [Methanocella arvoryzae]|uniref:redoxin domain-containing protein n=1 Tax=Methanocella arvoryzae TaxID=1175445 RepID=UPI000321E54A|nr:redoxin domain-containing protein [Methanocella arvoryzae]